MYWERIASYRKKVTVFELMAFFFALVMAMTIFALNFFVEGPMIQADEGSYLAGAAALAGFNNDMSGSYHTGYSILISPAFLVGDTPSIAWTSVKAINSILFFVTVFGLWLTAKNLKPEITEQNRLVGVVLVSLYPMWVVMVGYAFAQNAFVPLFLLVFLSFLRAIPGGTYTWILLGVVSGFLYWVHPTGVSPLIAIGISTAYITWHRRNYWALFSLLLTICIMVLAYRYVVTPWFQERMTLSGLEPRLHYPSISLFLATITTTDGIIELVARAAGQFFYLSIGTIGLIWLGFFALIKDSSKHLMSGTNAMDVLRSRAVTVFLGLSVLGTVTLSALMLTSIAEASAARLDQWMYGRYVESMIAPILLVGALSLSFQKILWAIPIALLFAGFLSFGLDGVIHTAPFNVSTFWQEFLLRDKGLWVWLLAGCSLIVFVAVLPRKLGVLLIISIFSFSSYLQIKWHVGTSHAVANRWSAAKTIRNQHIPGTCVGFDLSGADSYGKHVYWFDFALILFDYELKRMSFDQWFKTCDGPLLSYDRDLDARGFMVFPIAAGSNGGPLVWMKGRPLKSSVYPMIVSDKSNALRRAIGKGWYDFEESFVWSGPRSNLSLPIPNGCELGGCSVKLKLGVYAASVTRPVKVIIQTNAEDGPPLLPYIFHSPSWQEILVPLPSSQSVLNMSFSVPGAISPESLQGTHDKRVLGVVLQSIELMTP